MNNSYLLEQSKLHDSYYLYDEHVLLNNIQQLKQSFPLIHFIYSMKCNCNKHVVRSVLQQGFGVDAASLWEVKKSHEQGLLHDQIYYSAPGKTINDINVVIPKSFTV